MIAVCLAPLYFLFHYYVIRRSLKWMHACHGFFGRKGFIITYVSVYLFLTLTLPLGFFWSADWPLKRGIMHISNYWLGVCLYIILFTLVADLIVKLLWKCKVIPNDLYHSRKAFAVTGGVIFLSITVMSIYGVVNAKIVRVNDYEVTVDKACSAGDELNVVLVADLHLGYNMGTAQMRRMVDKVNQQDADIVVIAGDVFDNSYEALQDPEELRNILMSMKSTYGTYCVYGNHDINEPILAGFTFGSSKPKVNDEEMTQYLESMDITLLRDETVLIDDAFYLIGRRDEERPGNEEQTRMSIEALTADLDKTKPIIVIDHEPKELQETADAGVDLDLNGHTHDGQVFPANLTSKLIWENSAGYLKKGNMHNIVTSGVGLFGPDMRTFTDAEICSIKVNFNN
ncbi:MAG: metallophosphoesterase [Lachnospiraceae bacterium]|nr:metallophosphoesterase [Lachnospiraceae bacterium]